MFPERTGWYQPEDYRGRIPGTDETQAWPETRPDPPAYAVSSRQPADWRDTRMVRLTLNAFCLAAIVVCLALIIVSIRVVWAVWPR